MAQKVTSTDIKLALKEFHNGKPFTATTMSELNYLVNAPLESINRELREELGIELYVNTLPQIEDHSVSGFLMVKRVGEPVRFI